MNTADSAPILAYMGGDLDRKPRLRRDPGQINDLLHGRATRIVPVWRDRSLVVPGTESLGPGAVALTGDHARGALHLAHEVVLLGERDGTAWFAADLSKQELPDLTPLMGRAEFTNLKAVGALMDGAEAALLAYARGMLFWHRRNRHCGACGSATEAAEAGHMRRCTNPDCGLEHYPRTDPAVLVHVTRPGPEGGACLLARQATWPKGMYSCVAGFLEVGESLEACAIREVFEETGVEIGAPRYVVSQPWPFPASLMVGLTAEATSVKIDVDPAEIEDARWVTKTQLADPESIGITLPRAGALATVLIQKWMQS